MEERNVPNLPQPRKIYWILGFLMAILLLAFIHSHYSVHIMTRKYDPLIHSVMQIKQDAIKAHLWFEEAISGDQDRSIEKVNHLIDQSIAYTQEKLSTQDGNRNHTEDTSHYVMALQQVDEQLIRFKDMVNQRWNLSNIDSTQLRAATAVKFDRIYLSLLNKTETLISESESRLDRSFSVYHIIQWIMLGTIVLIVLLILFILRNFTKKQNSIYQSSVEREKNLDITLNSIGDAVITTDPSGKITRMNQVAAKLTGWREREALQQPLHSVFHIQEIHNGEKLDSPIEQIVKNEKNDQTSRDETLISKDGTAYKISINGSFIKNYKGNILGSIIVFRDITIHYDQEVEIRNREEKYRNFFYTSADCVFITSKDGELIELNEASKEMFGYDTLEELQKINVRNLYKNPATRDKFLQKIETEGYTHAFPVDLLKKNGDIIHALISSVPIKNEQGEVIKFQGTIKDVTELEESRRRINHLNSVLHALRNVDQLIIREKDRTQLIQKVCDTLTETRGFTNAWIVLLNAKKEAVFTAESGIGDDLQKLDKLLKEKAYPKCIQHILSTEDTLLIHNTVECSSCPLNTAYGNTGKVILSLKHQGKTYGILTVSLSEERTRDPEEQTLLTEVAADISFALHNLELEKRHHQTVRKLEKSEKKFRTLVDNAFDAIYLMRGRHYEYVNERFCDITGYSAQELTQNTFDFNQLLTKESRKHVENRYKARQEGKNIPNQYEIQLQAKDGTLKYV